MFSSNIDFWSAVIGFVGTVLIFLYGLPPQVDPNGHRALLLEGDDENEKIKAKKYKKIGYIGLLLIALSFVLQILKTVLSVWVK